MQSIGIWGLREEARKSWDYVISDEIVYFAEPVQGNREVAHVVSKKYFEGDLWFEIHITFPSDGQGETHLEVVLELMHVFGPTSQGKVQTDRTRVNRDRAVLVHGPEFVQLPKEVVPVGIPSVIRLKKVDNLCHCGWKKSEPVSVVSIVNSGTREGDVSFISLGKDTLGIEMRQGPCQLIQGRSQATYEVSEQHWNQIGPTINLDPANVKEIFKIVIIDDGIGFRGNPLLDFAPQRLEVFVRPAGLHFYVE
jgi:hypothetical protein